MSNCQWFDSRLEAYLCGDLNDEELRLCRVHLADCLDCSQQVESFVAIDTGMRQVFQHRLHVALQGSRAHSRSRVWKAAFAGVGLAVVAAVLMIVPVLLPEPPGPEIVQVPPGVPPLTSGDVKEKEPASGQVQRLKPDSDVPARVAVQPDLDSTAVDGPDFAITDAAGYTATLDTYHGRVLLFGVVSSEQKAAVVNLQQIYDTFGANPGIRILAVTRRTDAFLNATFPRYFNQGSRLLGVQAGEFVLIDDTGKSRLKGSLSDAASVARLRTQLEQELR